MEWIFLRPWALWLLLALALLRWLPLNGSDSSDPWKQLIDPELLRMLHGGDRLAGAGKGWARWWLGVAMALGILALAGPSLGQTTVPTRAPQVEAVIAMGLSASMGATDVTPDRLTRARIALGEWLDQQEGAEVGLVGFAGSAYKVSPLSRDLPTLKHMLKALRPDVMPRQGHDIAAALQTAASLFSSAPGPKHILLLSDGPVSPEALKLAQRLYEQGLRIDVLSIGTSEGAPIPLADGRFLTTPEGRLQLASVQTGPHQELAKRGGGLWADSTHFRPQGIDSAGQGHQDEGPGSGQVRRDDGPWLLLPLLLLAAMAFRPGFWFSSLLLAILLPAQQPAFAAEWPDALLNPLQRSVRAWQGEPSAEAAAQIPDPSWRGFAAYSSGDYAAAAEALSQTEDLSSRYNHALSLAQQDQIDAAISAFEQILQEAPEHADAQHNLALLQQVREQQQQQQEESSSSGDPGESEEDPSSSEEGQAADEPSAGSQDQNPGQESQAQDQASSDAQQAAEDAAAGQEQDEGGDEPAEQQPAEAAQSEATEASESLTTATTDTEAAEQALRQWLRRVDSDPSRLLRERFRRLEVERRKEGNSP